MTSNTIEQRLAELGLSLPVPWRLAPGTLTGSRLVRVHESRLFVGGHVPLDSQGQVCGPFGKVGAEVSLEQAQEAARRTLLAMLASLKEQLGSLDRIGAWLCVGGFVNTAPTFVEYPRILNAASRVITEAFGEASGSHARFAIGVAGLPWGAHRNGSRGVPHRTGGVMRLFERVYPSPVANTPIYMYRSGTVDEKNVRE